MCFNMSTHADDNNLVPYSAVMNVNFFHLNGFIIYHENESLLMNITNFGSSEIMMVELIVISL